MTDVSHKRKRENDISDYIYEFGNKNKKNKNEKDKDSGKKDDKDKEKKEQKPEQKKLPGKLIKITFEEIPLIPLPPEDEEELKLLAKPVTCANPFCDHQDGDEKVHNVLPAVNTIDDLMNLGRTYHCKRNKRCNDIDLEKLYNLITPLEKLKKMVGMKKVKEAIVNQIVYFLQGLQKDHNDMLHTVIEGPPGVGKTELGKILGEVYLKMGILTSGAFRVVKRGDLIAGYLGQTAMKTQGVIDSCRGGVLFIDEAYSLGNNELRDMYSKECLDTLNQNLTENKNRFLCIIAGYSDALDQCFFAYNDGLKRRFSFKYTIDKYSPEELRDIFLLKVEEIGWAIDLEDAKEIKNASFFKDNYQAFPNFGGDIETFLLNCKIYHGKRVFLLDKSKKKILTRIDILEAFKLYGSHRSLDKLEERRNKLLHLYI